MTVHVAAAQALSPEPPEWDLGDLYASPSDPRIEADLKAAREAVDDLVRLKGAFVAARANPERLGLLIAQAMTLTERFNNKLGAPAAYVALAASAARDDARLAKAESDLRARQAGISADALFLTLELNRLEDWEIEAALKAQPEAARWRPWIRRVRLNREHELAPDLERLLVDREPAIANWSRLYDETLARLRVDIGDEALSLTETLNRLSDPRPARRADAAQALAETLAEVEPTLGLCLNTLAFEKQVEDRWRRFTDPAQPRHLANEVDREAVDALEAAVVAAYPRVSHRYYALKARALGKDVLDHWDRNAPLSVEEPRRYGWGEARAIVLDAFQGLSPAFAERARRVLDRPWIDARPRPGKSSGAFSHPVTAEAHPYILMNFMGERRDVLTLAHELGHAVHQMLASPLGTLLADTPLTLAETASIFGEGLVFERLLADAAPEERRALLAGKIEDGLNTVFRQIAFHRFETRFHAARAEGEVAAAEIGAIWLDVMGESLGPAVRLDAGYGRYWGYVSHFVHAPFYVYAYAFGDLLVSALMERRRADPKGFAPLYEALLAAGGSKTYVEALAPFRMDPRRPAFWQEGCRRLERLVDEFETLV